MTTREWAGTIVTGILVFVGLWAGLALLYAVIP